MEKWLLIDRNKKFTEMLESEFLQLDTVRKMSYEELEIFCEELLRWKLFVANSVYLSEAAEGFMTLVNSDNLCN
jgi:hypothetical protein